MVKNTKGGNKAKRSKNSVDRTAGRPLVIKKAEDEIYGRITKRLGGEPPIVEVQCLDREVRRCVIRGKMKKRVWMNPDDVVLIKYNKDNIVSLDDKNKMETGEILHKYQPSEIMRLKSLGEIDHFLVIQKDSNDVTSIDDYDFDFAEDDEITNTLSSINLQSVKEISSSEDSSSEDSVDIDNI